MKNGILILFCLSWFVSCATVEQELQLRQLEMAHALEIAKIRADMPKAVLYEATAPDGTHTVVYMPQTNTPTGNSSYVARPLPKADLSTILPILSVAATITGQYFGFRTSEAMFNVLKGSQGTGYSNDGNTSTSTVINYSDASDRSTHSADQRLSYGDYSGNGTAGYDSHTDNSGSSTTNITDAFKMKTTDNSQRTIDYDYTETNTSAPPVIVPPVVIQPVITGGSND